MKYSQEPEIFTQETAKPYRGGPISVSGPSAVGKSTISKLLAKRLKYHMLDLDDEVAKEVGFVTTKEVIQKEGHPYFKEIQHAVLQKITESMSSDYVLAAGGEIVRLGYDQGLIKENRILIKKHTYNICLIPSIDLDEIVNILFPRLDDGKRDTRTEGKDGFKTYVKTAISQYIALADMVVLTHQSSAEKTLSLLIEWIQK